jgi:L-ascorbate metabolism protein UlaG (beta-lactamase superfamily)
MGPLKVTWIQHASVLVEWNNQTIYVDPSEGQFAARPKADLILITHTHGDHLKPDNIATLKKATTVVIGPAAAAGMVAGLVSMANGDSKTMNGVEIKAVAMYNTTAGRTNFHPMGTGNSYLLKLGGKTLYFSGDTECVPEVKALTGVDVAFLCMNLPYTMDVPAAAACAKAFAPKVVYPYHYRNQDNKLSDLAMFQSMVGTASEVRIRNWYP